MKIHTKLYMDYFGYNQDEYIPCEMCGGPCVDVHHIVLKGIGGSKTKDYIENLIGLCRVCHEKCHKNEYTKEFLTRIHKNNMKNGVGPLTFGLNFDTLPL
jgi:hypothetical protein